MPARHKDGLTHPAEAALGGAESDSRGREDGTHLTLTAASLIAWQIKDALIALVVLAALFGSAQLPSAPAWVKADLVLICLLCMTPSALEILVLNGIRHRRYSLDVYPERLVVSHGWIYRQVLTIPRSSVLNLSCRQGPVLRMLKLTSVTVLTIADHHKVGPLDATQADLIERFVNGDVSDVLT
jgi:membrane protein YdbS with pleckstrin-like domain